MNMSRAVFRKHGNALIPVDDHGLELLHTIRDQRDVMVSVKIARNPKHHRLLFALLNLIVERTGKFPNTRDALTALKVACGLVDPYIDAHDGKTYFVPRSIAFESMEQNEFSAFFDRAIFVTLQRWFPPGTNEKELRAEIELMTESNYAASLVPSKSRETERVDG